MEKLHYPEIGETLYYKKLANKLDVYLLPKKEFNKVYSIFTTRYGSIDNHFVPLNQTELKKVPDGIAHFLEHKMFEKVDGDVFFKFSQLGANANAFTSFNRTAYLFSGTSKIRENLETLIDFVQEPYFTPESVEKEKGIIAQEIRMYDDNPGWQLYFGTIQNMYHHHPVKIDIAGTVESINQITKELLDECYHTFYHPANMVLFMVGNFDENEMIELIETNQNNKDYDEMGKIEREYPEEPTEVYKEKEVKYMDVSTPKCMVGVKQKKPKTHGTEQVERELSINIALDVLFSKSSENYEKLIQEGIINDTFSYEYTDEDSYGFAILGGDTEVPDKLEEAVKEIMLDGTISDEDFERTKRKTIGEFLANLNSLEYIANKFVRYYLNEFNMFDAKKVLEELTKEKFDSYIHDFFDPNQMTCFQIHPKSE